MRYTKTHEWVESEEEGIAVIGISSRALHIYGEIVFVELPEVGEELEQDDPIGGIESIEGETVVIHSPITGEIIEVNGVLENSPDLINRSPEGDGWILKARMQSPKEIAALMTAEEYEEYEEEVMEEEEDFDDEDEYF